MAHMQTATLAINKMLPDRCTFHLGLGIGAKYELVVNLFKH